MSIFEYDEEKEKALIREAEREMGWNEGWEEGREAGMKAGMEEGIKAGMEEGIKEGIKVTIEACKSLNASREVVLRMITDKFAMEEKAAEQYMQLYW